jgi:hypothetical protein
VADLSRHQASVSQFQACRPRLTVLASF